MHRVVHRHGDAIGVLVASVFMLLLTALTATVTIRPQLASFDPNTGLTSANYSLQQTPTFFIDTQGLVSSDIHKVRAEVIGTNGRTLAAKPVVSLLPGRVDEFSVMVPPDAQPRPGIYTLEVTLTVNGLSKTITQDFTWGVLALNTNRSSYAPGENVAFGMAVLDDKGVTLCDSELVMEIIQPNNTTIRLSTGKKTIALSDTCVDKTVTNKADYLANFIPQNRGKYTLRLTALTKNGVRTMWSSFVVEDSAPFISERLETATRLYPAASYDVRARLYAEQAFLGTFEERTPHSFSLSAQQLVVTSKRGEKRVVSNDTLRLDVEGDDQVMRWEGLSLQSGDVAELTYTYKPPFISPAFYQLGPLKLMDSPGSVAFREPNPWQLASDAAGDVIVLWDSANGAIPAGWTCVSCTAGDAFYQLFPLGNSTYAGTGGGPESVTHTYTFSSGTGPSALTGNINIGLGGKVIATNTHTHTWGAPVIGSTDIKPPYKNLQFIKASNPLSLPLNAIAMFDVAAVGSLPANWASYTALNDPAATGVAGNGVYLRGENTNTTGGVATHTHTRAAVTSGPPSATANVSTATTQTGGTSTHTHTMTASTTSANNNDPSFISAVFAKVSVADEAIPNGMLAFFDSTTMPTGWTQQTNIGANALANRLIKGSLTAGTIGGATTHNHGGSQVITSGPPSATQTLPSGGLSNTTTGNATHTHNATYTISAGNSMPNYRSVIIGKFATVNITGTVYSDEGVTALGSQAVKIGLNGSGYRSTTAAANGTYTLAMPDPGPGGVFTVWLNTNGGAMGATITRSNGGAISGVDIYQNRLVTTHEDGGPLSNTNIGSCDKTSGSVCTDSDLHYDESSGSLTVDNDWRLFIKSGKTFTPGGTVTLSPGATAAGVGGDLKWGSATSTLNISSNALNVGGDWINTAGGNFTDTPSQTTTFTATATGFTVDAATKNFDRIVFNGSGGAWAFTPAATTVNVDSNFTITTGTVTAPSGTLNVGGNWTNAASFTHNSGTVRFTSTASGNTVNAGSSVFSNVTFDGAGGVWSPLTSTMNVVGNLTMTTGTFNTSSGSANVIVNGNVQGTAGVIDMTANNTFTQRIATGRTFGTTSGSTAWAFNNLTFSNSSGVSVTATTQTGGSGDITVLGNLVVSATGDTGATVLDAGNRTWKLTNPNGANPFDMDQASGSLTGATSTFEYTGDNDSGTVAVENGGYNALTLGGSVAESYLPEGSTTLSGNLLVTANATLGGTQNITVAGSVSGTGTVTLTAGTFTQRVAVANNFGSTGGGNDWTFNDLRFEDSAVADRTVTINGTGSGKIVTNGTLTVGNATDTNITTLDNETNDRVLDANGSLAITTRGSVLASSTALFTIGGSYTNSGSFAAGTGEVIFDTTSTGRTLAGNMTAGNKFYDLTFNGSGGAWSFGANSAETGRNFTITAGTVTAPSSTLTVSNNYANGGTFTHNSGLLVFNATSTGKTINPGSSSPFNNVTFNGSGGGWSFQTNAPTIAGDLLMVAGTLGSSENVTVNGNVQCSVTCGTITIATGVFTQSVSSNKSFGTNVATGTNWTFGNLAFHASAGNPTISFNATGTGQTIVNGTLSLAKAGGAGSVTVNDATNNRIIDVNGDVTIATNTTLQAPSSASFTVSGSWANSGVFTHGSGTVVFDATATGRTVDGGGSSFYNLTLSGSGGEWSPRTSTLTVANDLTLTAGVLGAAGDTSDVMVNGHITGTAGDIDITASGRTFTQRLASGKNFGPTTASNNWRFVNLSFSNSNGGATPVTATTVSGTGTMLVTGVMRVGVSGDAAGATTTLNAGDRNWTLSGTSGNPFQLFASPAGSLVGATSTFTFTGNNAGGNTQLQGASYYKLVINNASETFDANSAVTATSDVAVTAGIFALGTNDLAVGSSSVTDSGSIVVATSAALSQAASGTTYLRSSSGGNAQVGGAGTVTFYNLSIQPTVASAPTFTLGTASGQTVTVANTLTVGNGTNGAVLTALTHDPIVDINGSISLSANGTFVASDTATFTVAGSWANAGTFTHSAGTVTFDAPAAGRTIVSGGTGAGKTFSKVIFNGAAGGWAIQANNMTVLSDLTLTDIGSLSLESGRTLEVGGSYALCDSCASKTTWTGSTLYLNSATAYTVGSKTQGAEIYGTLQVGANTDIRTWRSSAATATVNATGSLYSQHHADILGALNIYGDYHVVSQDRWSYSTDFDGTVLVGPSQRQAVVRIETGSGRGVTVDGGGTLTVKGGGNGSSQFTDVDRIGGSGRYQMINSGTVTSEDAKFANPSFDGGSWSLLNTTVSGHDVTAGTLTVDWYLATQLANLDTLAPIDTPGADVTVAETSGSPASTVFKRASGAWGSPATSQTVDTGSDGRIAQPNSDDALRIREYSETSGGATYYQYNLTVSAQTTYATYDYKRDYGSYLTSTANTGSGESQVIGSAWFRDDIDTENAAPAINGPVTAGTWYGGMSPGMLAFWDSADGVVPTGWTCVSCSGGDPFYQRFLRATATYGGVGGGPESHGHNLPFSSATNGASFAAASGGTSLSTSSHTHGWDFGAGDDTTSGDNKPPYKHVQVIRGPVSGPNAWIVNLIVPFKTTTAPTGWTPYTALDGRYPRGENTNTTGGATTHGHDSSPLTSGSSGGAVGTSCTAGCSAVASTSHTHTLGATALASSNNDPLHVNVRFMKHTDTSTPPRADMLALFDHTTMPTDYFVVSASAPYQNNLLVGATGSIEGTGGAATHNHGGSLVITSSTPVEAAGSASSGATSTATGSHTHDVTYGIDTASSMPLYRDVVVAKYNPNLDPDAPTTLAQKKTNDVVITSGGWINETSVKFTASASDPDVTTQQLQLCVEKKDTGTSLTSTEDLCGTAVNETGSGSVNLSVTITGLSPDEYHWQARVKDQDGAYSSWVSYGTSDINTRDFGIDITAPTTAAIYDNTNIESQPSNTDADQNADGSLTTLSASWVDFDASASGLALYEYSIGTTAGATDVKAWTSNGTARFTRDTSLSLQTSKRYYTNIRATDTAGNVSSVASSNGQLVTPTLTFDIDVDASDTETSPPYAVDFGSLTAASVANSPKKIWVDFNTNGVAGGRVYVAGLNDGLRSVAAGFTIASSTGNLATATAGFGAQGSTATQTSGGPFLINSPYDGTSDIVGALNTTFQGIFTTSSPVQAARGSFLLKAKPSSLTPASNDYSEMLIIIAAGTY